MVYRTQHPRYSDLLSYTVDELSKQKPILVQDAEDSEYIFFFVNSNYPDYLLLYTVQLIEQLTVSDRVEDSRIYNDFFLIDSIYLPNYYQYFDIADFQEYHNYFLSTLIFLSL